MYYDYKNNTWLDVIYPGTSVLQEVNSHTAVMVEDYNAMFVYGGFINVNTPTDQFAVFNFTTRSWRVIPT